MHTDSRRRSFEDFFATATSHRPYDWQLLVAMDGLPEVLSVSTGLGKTETALAWAWRLLVDRQPEMLYLVGWLSTSGLFTAAAQRMSTSWHAWVLGRLGGSQAHMGNVAKRALGARRYQEAAALACLTVMAAATKSAVLRHWSMKVVGATARLSLPISRGEMAREQ